MLKTKLTKATVLGLSMSLLLAVPAYASTGAGQAGQMNMNNMQQQQGNMQNNMNNMQQQQNNTQNNINNMQQQQNNTQKTNNPLSNSAQYMINQGILKGSTDGNYNMCENVKRGDMSIMLVRAFNLTNSSDASESFSDVSDTSYYYDAIQTIKGLDIAKGDGQNFNPNNNMTLEEALLFVERALSAAGYEYSDIEISTLFEGRSLSEYATREDISTILYAVLGDSLEEISTTTIKNDDVVADTLTYVTDEDTAINFDEEDFNDVCEDATDETLSYVKFTLPSTSYGKLYYDYESSSDYDSKVTSSTKYYYDEDDGTYALSGITFVPTSDYTGTVKISYTGYNEDGETFTGTVKITVE